MMKLIIAILSIIISLTALGSEGNTPFFQNDIVTLKVTKDITLPAGQKEVRTSCGILLNVEKKERKRTIKSNKIITLEVYSTTRFWTILERVAGTTMIKKAFLHTMTFEEAEEIIKRCTELELVSIEPVQ